MTMTSKFSDMTSLLISFGIVLFHLSGLVAGLSFISISSPVLGLWQFSFTKEWPEIRKPEIFPSKFCPISRDWEELGKPNLPRMFAITCYWMLQNARLTAFTVSELLRENQQEGGEGGGGTTHFPPMRLGLKNSYIENSEKVLCFESLVKKHKKCSKNFPSSLRYIFTVIWK